MGDIISSKHDHLLNMSVGHIPEESLRSNIFSMSQQTNNKVL